MSRARVIFDSALDMEQGEKMLITCTSHKQMETLRVSLYKQRQLWQKQSHDGSDIGVTSKSQGDKFFLILEKLDPISPPVILDKDGRLKKVVSLAEPDTPETVTPEDTRITVEFAQDRDRQRALMREDGISEEEIAAYFGEEVSP